MGEASVIQPKYLPSLAELLCSTAHLPRALGSLPEDSITARIKSLAGSILSVVLIAKGLWARHQ